MAASGLGSVAPTPRAESAITTTWPRGPLLPSDWVPPDASKLGDESALVGRWIRLVKLDVKKHAPALFKAFDEDDGSMWTYLADYGPFATAEELREALSRPNDYISFALVVPDSENCSDRSSAVPVGVASYLSIQERHGSIEVGGLMFSPALRRSRAATEAMYLMMRRAFELGFRRYEWKTDSFNARSRRAAERLGFKFEGTFRQHRVSKGHNRDTVWYSITDREWPKLHGRFEAWLSPSNFDEHGQQRSRLEDVLPSVDQEDEASENNKQKRARTESR